MIFFEQEDKRHPEAIRNISYGFILGALTTFFALAIQLGLNYLFAETEIGSRSPLAITIFATVEEILKFLAVFYIVRVHRYFDEPVDAMIYMVTVALGFAAVENVASLITQGGILQSGLTLKTFEILTLRFLGATLLHSLASAVVGFHWAVGLIAKKNIGWHIFAGLVIASLLHTVFNYLIISTGPASWALAFVIIISFFVLIDFEKLKTKEG